MSHTLTTESINYEDFNKIHGKGDKVYFAIHLLDQKIYNISKSEVTEAVPDLKMDKYEVFYLKDDSILYFHLNKLHATFGRDPSPETMATFIGIAHKLDDTEDQELEIVILSPKFKNRYAWHASYNKMLGSIVENINTIL